MGPGWGWDPGPGPGPWPPTCHSPSAARVAMEEGVIGGSKSTSGPSRALPSPTLPSLTTPTRGPLQLVSRDDESL